MNLINGDLLYIGDKKFKIDECIGTGGSCIAYRVSYKENDEITHYGILKEYCPAFLKDYKQNIRDENGALLVPKECFKQFEEGLEYFRYTYKAINDYLSSNLSASNYHTVQMGLYDGNNTAYTLTSCDYGKIYEETEDNNLYMLLNIMLSVTKAVEMYHNAGFLHLDIKPKNILVLDGVTDLIKLFDFDSLTSIKSIECRECDRLPIPEGIYVPELNNKNLRNVGVSTDIYEIGAMTFNRLFGYAPNSNCILSDVKYDYDSVKLLNGASPKIKYELNELFKHTLRVSPRERYKSTKELKLQLSKLISLTSDGAPYVLNMPKWQPSYYSIGRQDEIKQIKSRLDSDGYVFVKAMGGTGKSELVKMYAKKYADEYHTVQFCKYAGSLKSVVSSIEISGVNNNDYSNVEELIKEKNKVLHSCDNHTLLIIDNFNVTYDEYLREFLPADNNGFKVIFTTRCDPANEYYSNKVFELSVLPEDVALVLFYNHSGLEKTIENDEIIKKILDIIQYNTLVLVLLARSIKKTGCKLNKILNKLNNSELDSIDGEVFHEFDFLSIDGQNYNKIFAHLNTIFNLSDLTDIQKEILMDMSVVANIGITTHSFIEYCECQYINLNEIEHLYSVGWIEENNGTISLHPIISDLLAGNDSIEKKTSYYCIVEHIISFCTDFDSGHIDVINRDFAYLNHLDKRLKCKLSFEAVDTKLLLAKTYFSLYDAKNAFNKYNEVKDLIKGSFRYKPRYCFVYFGLAELEENFGSLDQAVEFYKKAIAYFKKTINNFYRLCFDSLCGIASCYVKKHNYEMAYDYYIRAYDYSQNCGINDRIKQVVFVSTKKDLTECIPTLCDNIIEVCTELERNKEIARFQSIKENTKNIIFSKIDDESKEGFDEENEAIDHLNKAKDLFYKSNIKKGLEELFKYLEFVKETYGEESPIYAEGLGNVLPFLITANSDDGNISISVLNDTFEFLKCKYGENSMRLAEYLILVSEALFETKEIDFSKKCAEKAKEICINLNKKKSFTYQEANLVIVNSLIYQSDMDRLRDVVDEIDFDMFKSKSDFEKLVKYAGMALLELSEYDRAILICKELIKKQTVTPIIFCMSCYIIVQSYLGQNNFDDALTYLEIEKPILESLDDCQQKNEYLALYYYGCAVVKLYQDKKDEALFIIDYALENICIDNEFINHMVKCRLYLIKTQLYLNENDFENALNSISSIENFLNDDGILQKFRIEILENLAVCYAANGEIAKGIDYYTKFESANEQIGKSVSESKLISDVFFIDALLASGSRNVYQYIEKAESLVEKLNLYDSIYNARLINSLGVYLSDFEGNHTTAEETCKKAKVILEKNGYDNTPLYKQVLQNIDYLREISIKEIVRNMAKSKIYEEDLENE